MVIITRFSCGDKVWVTRGGTIPLQGTVGLVRAEIVNSPGRVGETVFDNYKSQKSYKEEYMLVETGIYSGSLYTLGKNIFASKVECELAIAVATNP